MWTKAELSHDHLVGYAMEYFQLIRAVPELVQNVIANSSDSSPKASINSNLDEEKEHVMFWEKFASSLEISSHELNSYCGLVESNQSVSELKEITSESLESAVAAIYAYEL